MRFRNRSAWAPERNCVLVLHFLFLCACACVCVCDLCRCLCCLFIVLLTVYGSCLLWHNNLKLLNQFAVDNAISQGRWVLLTPVMKLQSCDSPPLLLWSMFYDFILNNTTIINNSHLSCLIERGPILFFILCHIYYVTTVDVLVHIIHGQCFNILCEPKDQVTSCFKHAVQDSFSALRSLWIFTTHVAD